MANHQEPPIPEYPVDALEALKMAGLMPRPLVRYEGETEKEYIHRTRCQIRQAVFNMKTDMKLDSWRVGVKRARVFDPDQIRERKKAMFQHHPPPVVESEDLPTQN